MSKLKESHIGFEDLPHGIPRDKWNRYQLGRLERLGFDGERLTVFKYVKQSGINCFESVWGSSKLWRVGSYTHESKWQTGVIGNIKGLYAAGLSYFIKNRLFTGYPLLLLEMKAEHFIDTDGEVVIASAYKTLDVLAKGLPRQIIEAYRIAPPDIKRNLGQSQSWQDVSRILHLH